MAKQSKKIQPEQELRYYDMPVELRAAGEGDESRTIVGYAFKWDVLSNRIGWFREKIDRGALDGVDISKMDIVALFNHNRDQILARTISQTLTLEVDDTGLRYEFEAPNTTAGNDLLESVKRGDVAHSSFSFTIAPGGDAWEDDEEDGEIRTILKFKRLFDVSPVVFPAYSDTEVAKRSYDEFKGQQDTPAPFRREMARRKLNLMCNK